MKKYLFSAIPFLFILSLYHNQSVAEPSPLGEFSEEWNDARFLNCNTAASCSYMSQDEKKVMYILNLLRTDPVLFANTVVRKYPDFTHQESLRNVAEYKSLIAELQKTESLPLLYPDSFCFASAHCHAVSSGRSGYTGHQRQTKECKAETHFLGECCDYGNKEPLAVIMALLIDEGVPSLGHRAICIGPYEKAGISIQPHKVYGTCAVLDFY